MTDAWLSAWAKTDRDQLDPGTVTAWLPLHQHLADTAGIAALLVEQWVPRRVVDRIAADLDGDVSDVRTVATWLAATHDVGKISPAFAVQNGTLVDAMRDRGLIAHPALAIDPDRSRARHELVGLRAVRDFLTDELRFDKDIAAQFASVVGGHHGEPPSSGLKGWLRSRKDLAGTGTWQTAREDALGWATELVGGPAALAPYARLRVSQPAQALLSAIVIVADWIASNAELLPLRPLHTARDEPSLADPAETAARVEAAWSELNLPPRWTPAPVEDVAATFAARFNRAPDTPRPVQRAAVEAALAQPEPGLVLVEAPMGEGKTEAALLAAEVLAVRLGADGCFVALPTRATTDAMFPRVLSWLRNLPGMPTDVSVMLAHGTASLNDHYRGLLRRGFLAGIGMDDDSCDEVGIAHRWLVGRRKGPLAQFVLGTVDQVLFGALKSRHLMMRHLALAGKVVIIDEVHAYDVFMARYLDRVLHWLGAYGTPVVLLSATLPAGRRAELIAAYDRGRGAVPAELDDDPGYPVVLASGCLPRTAPASGDPRPVAVEQLSDDLDDLVATLRTALAAGGCAVVIRNTVSRVQETADRLVDEFGDEAITVAHSRFLACDRARIDADLVRRFGPPGASTERPTRPHIVVASQVVEQSLDIDFDLMITDLAPVDLVLQRMGRLHRHQRPRPTGLEQPRCLLAGVEDWAATPARAVRGGRAVYDEHPLLRAAALLVDRTSVVLPTDIPGLVQAAYGAEPLGEPSWQDAMVEAERAHAQKADKRRENADIFVLAEVGGPDSTIDGWIRAGVGDPDDEPRRGSGQVRDGDESIEVLVVQHDRDGGLLTPDWLPKNGGVQIPLDGPIEGGLARTIAACALRLPPAMSRMDAVGDGVIDALERNRVTSFDSHPLLKGQLLLVLDADRTARVEEGPARFAVSYDIHRGFVHESIGDG